MYRNLVCPWDADAPESVHLCPYPEADESLLDLKLNERAATAQRVVNMGHKLRADASLRVRQPLAELRYACSAPEQREAIASLADVILEELNVKTLTERENLDDLVKYSYKPNLKTLGPKYGKLLGKLREQLPNMDDATLGPLRTGNAVTVQIDDVEVVLEPDDVLVSTEQAADWVCTDDAGIQIAISTSLSPELLREGMARDFVRHTQQRRKDEGLEILDRITIHYATEDDEAASAIEEWKSYVWNEYIHKETLADSIERVPWGTLEGKPVAVGTAKVVIEIAKSD
jgi:isoleucyl-tRNA synthetase